MAANGLAKIGPTENGHAVTTPSRHGRAVSIILVALLEFGRRWAVEGRVLEARTEHLEVLRDYGRAQARAGAVRDYDPETVAADRERARRFEDWLATVHRLAGEIRTATADLHQAATAAATKGRLIGEMPPEPLLVMMTSTVVIAMTIAPSAHDLIYTTLRDDLNWVISAATGVVIGVMLAWGVVQENSRTALPSRAALLGGVILGLGFAILRLAVAEDLGEVIYALGLCAIECGVLVFIEATGRQYRDEVAGWHERNDAAGQAAATADCQRQKHESLVAAKADIDRAIEGHLVRTDERRELSGDFESFEAACVRAVCSGYFRGIAENNGRAEGYAYAN